MEKDAKPNDANCLSESINLFKIHKKISEY